jgi:NAD(P)-dependent dehydrogenase (short-subunit alcohol dehydrogenase family)
MVDDLNGQVAVVFGASSGMGLATAQAFAQAGAAVVLAARRGDRVREAAARISANGSRALGLAADVSRREQVDAVIDAALARFGDLDLVVNAAGINIKDRRLEALTAENWNAVLATNLTGAFNTLHAALPHLRQRGGGVIVQIGSVSGRYGDWSGAAYQASKHGLVGLCYAAMVEERQHGLRITALLPGLVDTPLLKHRPVPVPPETLAQALQPEDVAQACLFLARLPPRAYVPELMLLPGALQCVGQTAT